jgi:hypothetical protein
MRRVVVARTTGWRRRHAGCYSPVTGCGWCHVHSLIHLGTRGRPWWAAKCSADPLQARHKCTQHSNMYICSDSFLMQDADNPLSIDGPRRRARCRLRVNAARLSGLHELQRHEGTSVGAASAQACAATDVSGPHSPPRPHFTRPSLTHKPRAVANAYEPPAGGRRRYGSAAGPQLLALHGQMHAAGAPRVRLLPPQAPSIPAAGANSADVRRDTWLPVLRRFHAGEGWRVPPLVAAVPLPQSCWHANSPFPWPVGR